MVDRVAMYKALKEAFDRYFYRNIGPGYSEKDNTRSWGIYDGMLTMYSLATGEEREAVYERLWESVEN